MSDTKCARQCQLVVAHDRKRLATPKDGGLHLHFAARAPARDAHIRFCRSGRDRNGSEWTRPPPYRWTTPEGEERHAPVVNFASIRIERAFRGAALRAVQKPAKRGPAP
jgi:hypothetical protein